MRVSWWMALRVWLGMLTGLTLYQMATDQNWWMVLEISSYNAMAILALMLAALLD